MRHRVLINGARGLLAALVVYPLAERLQGRDIRSKCRALASEMGRPFGERRRSSWAALIDLLRFAGVEVPYYRDLFARIAFDPEKLTRDPRYLQDLPYLTKDIIRSEGERLLRTDHGDARKHVAKTGGSTGASAQIIYDQAAADWSSAVTRYARSTLAGSGKGGAARSELHFASLFPEPFPLLDRLRERVKCLATNRHNVFFSTLDPAELKEIWRTIKSVRPSIVHCHPSTMFHLAQFVLAEGRCDRAFEVFESSGELLEPRQREAIASAFGCAVIDRYGLAEAGVVAYQSDPHGRGMLVFDPFCWPEIAASDGEDAPRDDNGGRGELVVTTLRNRMMPLIRYRTGDLAVLDETSRGFVVRDMIGRTHDVIDVAGRRIPTHVLQDFLDRIGGVRTFQIEVGRDRPTLRIVAEPDADRDGICDRVATWWGGGIDVQFIEPSELRLQGWRRKFRHVVDASAVAPPAALADAEAASHP